MIISPMVYEEQQLQELFTNDDDDGQSQIRVAHLNIHVAMICEQCIPVY